MADVTIEAAAGPTQCGRALRSGPFWTSPTVGYVVYLNATYDLVYRKTADGGATWGAAQVVVAAASCDAAAYDCWADWQTDGDAGTKIHIAYMSLDTEEVRYVYLDTSGDSVGGDDLIETCQGTATFYSAVVGFYYETLSITKTRGGNLAVAFRYRDTDSVNFDSFYTSPDAATWTSKTSPLEGIRGDFILLFPGNEADNQDVWAAYWDGSADEISLKTFDDSGNSWSEQSISGSMVESASYKQWGGAIRLSDGHLILAAWSECDTATADLKVWDINGAGSITAKTNIITDTSEYFVCAVFINQDNDDIYVSYVGGTAAYSLTKCFYQLSQDGGANWDGQTAMQADAEDDEKWISCGAAKAANGGKFLPVWFNDDLNDIFCNTDNGISIAAAGGVTAQAVGGGSVAIAGTLGRNIFISVGAGSITPSGALGLLTKIAVGAGSLASAGVLGLLTKIATGSGSIAIAATLGLKTKIAVGSGSIAIAGTLGRKIKIAVGAGSVAISSSLGLLTKIAVGGGSIAIAGSLAIVDQIRKLTIRMITAAKHKVNIITAGG